MKSLQIKFLEKNQLNQILVGLSFSLFLLISVDNLVLQGTGICSCKLSKIYKRQREICCHKGTAQPCRPEAQSLFTLT